MILLALIQAITPIPATDRLNVNSTFMSYGRGTMSCGQWTDDHKPGNEVIAVVDRNWLEGFITAANVFVVATGGNVAPDADTSGMEHFVSNFCEAHPLSKINDASLALFGELYHRKITK